MSPEPNLFRDDPSPVHGDARALVPLILIACALTALIVGASPDRKMATGFCVAIAAGFGVFTLLGRMVPRLVARIALSRMDTRARGAARLGIAFLDRANGPAPGLILALGMGLSGLATVHLLHGAVASQVDDVLPHSAPSFYFIDIQPSDVPRFDAVLHAQRTATTIREMPSMRTRVVALDGTPVAQVHATTASQWALRGDHGLTFSGEPPSDTHLAAGQWWATDYTGPPLLSLDAGLASGWGVHVGSTVTLNVLGRNLDFRIANLRDVAWRSLHMNFAFVASPGLLSHAPHSVIATVGTDGDAAHDADVLEAVTDALPGVTGIRVADVLATLSDMVTRLTQALAVMAVLVLMAGLLVIAATLFASGKQRLADTAILRALGATDRQIGTLWLVEFAVVGLTAGTMAALFGTMASLAAEHWLLRVPLTVQPVAVVEIIGGGLLLILIAGFLVQRPALRVRPTALFRV